MCFAQLRLVSLKISDALRVGDWVLITGAPLGPRTETNAEQPGVKVPCRLDGGVKG